MNYVKRTVRILIVGIILLALLGCNAQNTPVTSGTPTSVPTASPSGGVSSGKTIADYLAPKPNTIYVYETNIDKVANWYIFNLYINDDNTWQRIIALDGGNVAELLKVDDSGLHLVYTTSNSSPTDDFRQYEPNEDMLIMKAPLMLGETWVCQKAEQNTQTAEIIGFDEEVSTPHGDYRAMAIKYTNSADDAYRVDYYVLGLGMVKMVTYTGDMEISVALTEIKEDMAFTMSVGLFYADKLEPAYEVMNVNMATNAAIERVFEQLFVEQTEGRTSIFTKETKINAIRVDRENEKATIDLEKAFVDNISADAEEDTLNALVNTIGNYFGVKEVFIHIDGGAYEGKTVKLAIDEPRAVSFTEGE